MNNDRPGIVKTVALKELKDFFRDPRSLVLSLLLPLVLFPLLFWVLSVDREKSPDKDRVFRIGIESGFDAGEWNLDSEKISVSFLENTYPLQWENDFDAILLIHPDTGKPVILYDNTDPASVAAFAYLESINSLPAAAREHIGERRTPELGFPLYPEDIAAGKIFLGLMAPFIFFIFAITCPLPVSADLSAGEKERGSLEPLLSTAARRSGIIAGKLVAAFISGMCSVCAYLLAIFISCVITPEIIGEQTMRFAVSFSQTAALSLLLVTMTALFAAVEICAGFITRSVREAQLLSMPLLMVGMGAVYIAQNLDISGKHAVYVHIPLVNLALAVREAAVGRMIPGDMTAAFLWSAVYLFVISFTAVFVFQREFSFIRGGNRKTYLARSRNSRYSR